MKQNRRRRHLRPFPTRSQVNQQIQRVRSALQAFQLEYVPRHSDAECPFGKSRVIAKKWQATRIVACQSGTTRRNNSILTSPPCDS